MFNISVVSNRNTSGSVKRARDKRSVGGKKAAKKIDATQARALCFCMSENLTILRRIRIVRTIGNWNAIPISVDVIRILERSMLISRMFPISSSTSS